MKGEQGEGGGGNEVVDRVLTTEERVCILQYLFGVERERAEDAVKAADRKLLQEASPFPFSPPRSLSSPSDAGPISYILPINTPMTTILRDIGMDGRGLFRLLQADARVIADEMRSDEERDGGGEKVGKEEMEGEGVSTGGEKKDKKKAKTKSQGSIIKKKRGRRKKGEEHAAFVVSVEEVFTSHQLLFIEGIKNLVSNTPLSVFDICKVMERDPSPFMPRHIPSHLPSLSAIEQVCQQVCEEERERKSRREECEKLGEVELEADRRKRRQQAGIRAGAPFQLITAGCSAEGERLSHAYTQVVNSHPLLLLVGGDSHPSIRTLKQALASHLDVREEDVVRMMLLSPTLLHLTPAGVSNRLALLRSMLRLGEMKTATTPLHDDDTSVRSGVASGAPPFETEVKEEREREKKGRESVVSMSVNERVAAPLCDLLLADPSLLYRKREEIALGTKSLAILGFTKSEIKTMVCSYPSLLYTQRYKMRNKIRILKDRGRFSSVEVRRLLVEEPWLLGDELSEAKLSFACMYMLTKMRGYEKRDVLRHPIFFSLPLHDRVIPRHAYAVEKGARPPFPLLLLASDVAFASYFKSPLHDFIAFKKTYRFDRTSMSKRAYMPSRTTMKVAVRKKLRRERERALKRQRKGNGEGK